MQNRFAIELDVATGMAATDFVQKLDEQIAELENQLTLVKSVRSTVARSFDIEEKTAGNGEDKTRSIPRHVHTGINTSDESSLAS
jgi:hypothetical protein